MSSSDHLHSQQFHQQQLFNPGPVDKGYEAPSSSPSISVTGGGNPSKEGTWDRSSGSKNDKTHFPGMRAPQTSPYIPAHGKVVTKRFQAAISHKQTDVSKTNEYTTYYHASDSPSPPHTVDHPNNDTFSQPSWAERKGSNDVLFAGTRAAAQSLDRPFLHRYSVPKSAESATIMADDDAGTMTRKFVNESLYSAGDSPTLFESIPARRLAVANRNEVQRMRNYVEDKGKISVIMPKAKMEKLGIKYQGISKTSGGKRVSGGKDAHFDLTRNQ